MGGAGESPAEVGGGGFSMFDSVFDGVADMAADFACTLPGGLEAAGELFCCPVVKLVCVAAHDVLLCASAPPSREVFGTAAQRGMKR
jgi:hypothetical protein